MKKLTRRNLFRKTAMAAVGAAGAAALWPATNFIRGRPGRDVIVIICDALRADRIGAPDPSGASLTPHIDALAARGVAFSHAYAPSSFTPISMQAIMHDCNPAHVNYGLQAGSPADDADNISARLAARGYLPLFACANEVLDTPAFTNGFAHSRTLALGELFKAKRTRGQGGAAAPGIYAPSLNRSVARMLAGARRKVRRQPVYLQVHYMDTHEPYNRGVDLADPMADYVCCWAVRKALKDKREFLRDDMTTADAMTRLVRYYDSAVRRLDGHIGYLLMSLVEYGLLDDALVIVTADHGEEFADSAETERLHVGHLGPLTEEQLRVPLVICSTRQAEYLPPGGVIPPRVASSRVINDVIDHYSSPERGYSQTAAAMAALKYPAHPVTSALSWPPENVDELAYVRQDWKVRKFRASGRYAAFRYGDGALHDAPVEPWMVRALQEAFEGRSREKRTLSASEEEKLRALGYLR